MKIGNVDNACHRLTLKDYFMIGASLLSLGLFGIAAVTATLVLGSRNVIAAPGKSDFYRAAQYRKNMT